MVGYRDGDGSSDDPMDDATLQRQLQARLEYVKNHLIIKVRTHAFCNILGGWGAIRYMQKVLSSIYFSHFSR